MKELDYFKIGSTFGGNQEWMKDYWMRLGGCAALAAVDTCIYLQGKLGVENLCDFDATNMTRDDYCRFGMIMKPYIAPRFSGVNRIDIYTDGFGKYLRQRGSDAIKMEAFPITADYDVAVKALCSQLDADLPVPFLLLRHKNSKFKDFYWHWFMLTGYRNEEAELEVCFTTYGGYVWHSFRELWESGHDDASGMVIYTLDK